MGFNDFLCRPRWGWVVGVAVVTIAGCAADLQTPEKFNTGAGTVIPTCASDVLKQRCTQSGCHDAKTRAGSLDLASTGLDARLVDKPATFASLAPDTCPKPGSVFLISTADPAESWMLKKVNKDGHGKCGSSMPPDEREALQGSEAKCYEDWIRAYGKGGGSTGGGSSTGGTTGTGGSGTGGVTPWGEENGGSSNR